MKLITYNILRGGIDEYGSRIDSIIEVISEAKPDFVALQEAQDFEKDGRMRLREISNRISLHYCALSPGTPREWDRHSNVASLSRDPAKKRFKFLGCKITGGALLTVIDSPIGELAICNFHLDAYEEDRRLQEIEAILKIMSGNTHQILLGDFNSVAHVDNYDPKTLQVEPRFDLMNKLKRDYVDVADYVGLDDRSTHPTPSNTNPKFTMPIRIDYILVSHSLAGYIKDAAVIKTPDSEKASDHYPLEVVFDLK